MCRPGGRRRSPAVNWPAGARTARPSWSRSDAGRSRPGRGASSSPPSSTSASAAAPRTRNARSSNGKSSSSASSRSCPSSSSTCRPIKLATPSGPESEGSAKSLAWTDARSSGLGPTASSSTLSSGARPGRRRSKRPSRTGRDGRSRSSGCSPATSSCSRRPARFRTKSIASRSARSAPSQRCSSRYRLMAG